MKTKNKVERYIERYCKHLVTKTVYSARSTYYHMGCRIIRVSDHVAIHSDGHLSIILDSHDDEHFIVHAVSSGEISVLNYKELKELIRSLRLLPAVVYVANVKPKEEPVVKEVLKIDPTHVLGHPLQEFGPKHRAVIQNTLKALLKGKTK
jgi:hypothetical protein